MAFLDVDQVALLCDFAGGRRIPRREQFEAWKRRVLLLGHWLNGGYGVRDLAAKYGLTESAVKRMLSIARRKMIRARHGVPHGWIAAGEMALGDAGSPTRRVKETE